MLTLIAEEDFGIYKAKKNVDAERWENILNMEGKVAAIYSKWYGCSGIQCANPL